jgi:hypothetical protein
VGRESSRALTKIPVVEQLHESQLGIDRPGGILERGSG